MLDQTRDTPTSSSAVDETRSLSELKSDFWYRHRNVMTVLLIAFAWPLLLIAPPTIEPDHLVGALANYLGWLMFMGGMGLRLWSLRTIGGRKSRELVNYGPFSLCRNPLYVGTFLMMFSGIVFMGSVIFVAASLVVVAIYCHGVVPAEERHLSYVLGEPYQRYLATVPRWWPRRSGYAPTPVVDIAHHALDREFRRMLGWLVFPLMALLTVWIQHQPWCWHWLPRC